MKNPVDISNTCFGSWENLLELIDRKLEYYLPIFHIYDFLKIGGCLSTKVLDPSCPVYFSDAIARRCIATYDPQEPLNSALERCIVDELHHRSIITDDADPEEVQMEEITWQMFPLDALLRLVWRQREQRIPFYLRKESEGKLSDPFLVEAENGCFRLTQGTHQRLYETDAPLPDFDTFCQKIHRFFRLATEDYGYFVPDFVWLAVKE